MCLPSVFASPQASRVASSSLPAADGAMAVVANVQLAEKRDATALYNMLVSARQCTIAATCQGL